MKKANDYSIYCGNKGSLIHEESPVFMIKIKFDKKYSYEMIVDWMSSSEEIWVWNKAITKWKDIIKFSNNTLITHTIYSPSFLIEKREFIEKRFVTSIKDPKGNKQKTLIFKSSVPNHLLSNPEWKLHGTTLFSIWMIKYGKFKIDLHFNNFWHIESDTDQTTLTMIEQVHYGLKNIDKYTKVALPAQVDKMYRNLIEYMNRKLEEDAFSI